MFGKPQKRGAVQRPAQSQTPQKLIPNWLWMLFGTLVGLSIAVLLFLWQPWQPAARDLPADPTANVDSADASTTTDAKADYEFYDLLPKQQVTPVPDQEVPLSSSRDAEPLPSPLPTDEGVDESVLTSQNQATPDPFESGLQIERAPQYLLQINSFQDPDDADRQRAEVLLVGLSADVRQHVDATGTRWYRVVSGPYANRDEAENAHRLLQDSGIAALVVEQR